MKKIHLFTDTHLPNDGWLQGCVICNRITGIIKLVNNDKLPLHLLCKKNVRYSEIYGYICKDCKQFRKKNFYKSCIRCLNYYY